MTGVERIPCHKWKIITMPTAFPVIVRFMLAIVLCQHIFVFAQWMSRALTRVGIFYQFLAFHNMYSGVLEAQGTVGPML